MNKQIEDSAEGIAHLLDMMCRTRFKFYEHDACDVKCPERQSITTFLDFMVSTKQSEEESCCKGYPDFLDYPLEYQSDEDLKKLLKERGIIV